MSKEKKNSLFYVKIFLSVVAAVFLMAIFLRIYNSYTQRQFTENVFNILVISDKYVGVVGIDEGDERLHAVLVTKELDTIKKRNILIQSINFGIPIHAYISFPDTMRAPAPTKEFFSINRLRVVTTDMGVNIKNISFFDWIKLYKISKNLEEKDIVVKTYATIKDLSRLLGAEEESFLRNSDIANRKTSMQIVNGTSINGLGNRVGDMFSRFGFNVVSVTTNPTDKSVIYYNGDSSYDDALMVAKSFGFPVEKSSEYAIAAVTLIIGEESELLLEDLAY